MARQARCGTGTGSEPRTAYPLLRTRTMDTLLDVFEVLLAGLNAWRRLS
jgi:hypothetical protein